VKNVHLNIPPIQNFTFKREGGFFLLLYYGTVFVRDKNILLVDGKLFGKEGWHAIFLE